MERVTVRRVSAITPASGSPETESGEWVGALRETPSDSHPRRANRPVTEFSLMEPPRTTRHPAMG